MSVNHVSSDADSNSGVAGQLHYNNSLDNSEAGQRENEPLRETLDLELEVLRTRERVLVLETEARMVKKPKVKSKKVLSFDGKGLLDIFLMELETEAENQNLEGNDAAMGQLVKGALSGPALAWAASLGDKRPRGYQEWIRLLQATYLRTGAKAEAQNALKNLKQVTDGVTFNARFNTLVQQAGYIMESEQTKTAYYEALSLQVLEASIGKMTGKESLLEIQAQTESIINQIIQLNQRKGIRSTFWQHAKKNGAEKNAERADVHVTADNERKCFKCGKPGHIAKQCRSKEDGAANGQQSEVKCYACGKAGHVQRFCPRFMEWKKRIREDDGKTMEDF